MSEDGTKPRGRKVYQAKSFAKSVMSCPDCFVTLKEPVDQCPRCGYTGQNSMARFPFVAPAMARFIDPGNHLNEGGREKIGRLLTELSKKYPQPRFCFCIIDLAEEADPREFGFWLMNASPVDDQGEAQLRPWTILLVIDDVNGRASVSVGYAIEPFLNDQDWNAIIRQEQKHFFARDYALAITKYLEGAEGILNEGAKRVELKTKKDGNEDPKGERRKKRRRST